MVAVGFSPQIADIVSNRQAVASRLIALQVEIDKVADDDPFRKHGACFRQLLQDGFQVTADLLNLHEVGTKNFDPNRHPRKEHTHGRVERNGRNRSSVWMERSIKSGTVVINKAELPELERNRVAGKQAMEKGLTLLLV